MDLFMAVFAATGLTYLVTGSKLLGEGWIPARPILQRNRIIAGLAQCTFCVGFWASIGVSHFTIRTHQATLVTAAGAVLGIVIGLGLLPPNPAKILGWAAVGALFGALPAALGALIYLDPWVAVGVVQRALGVAFAVMLLNDLRDALLHLGALALSPRGNPAAPAGRPFQHVPAQNPAPVVEDPARSGRPADG